MAEAGPATGGASSPFPSPRVRLSSALNANCTLLRPADARVGQVDRQELLQQADVNELMRNGSNGREASGNGEAAKGLGTPRGARSGAQLGMRRAACASRSGPPSLVLLVDELASLSRSFRPPACTLQIDLPEASVRKQRWRLPLVVSSRSVRRSHPPLRRHRDTSATS